MFLTKHAWMGAVGLLLLPGPARADARACIADNDEAHRLRAAGQLLLAREKLSACAQASCPDIIRNECSRLLGEVTRDVPSLVVRVRDARGADTTAFTLKLDGRTSDEAKRGLPISLDPGAHRVVVAFASGQRVTQEVLLVIGEKRRELVIREPAPAPAGERAPTERESAAGPPWTFYALASTGAVALGSFALFGLRGRDKQSDMESRCAPFCPQDEIDAMRRDYLIADISLGVGVVALGAAGWVLFDSQSTETRASGVAVRVTPRQIELGGRF